MLIVQVNMLTFLNYLNKKNLIFEFMEVENFQPLDGIWSGRGGYYSYKFNVKGDDCKDVTSKEEQCYKVSFQGTPYNEISINFFRAGSVKDAGKNVQVDVGKSVLYAVNQFIEYYKPEKINWSAIGKTKTNNIKGVVVNPNARSKIYNIFFVENYFPHLYVPKPGYTGSSRWISRKLYDEVYVPTGSPPIPESMNQKTSRKQKFEFIENFKQNETPFNLERTQLEVGYISRKEQEWEKKETDDFENPKELKTNDLVYFEKSENIHDKNFDVPNFGIIERITKLINGKNISDRVPMVEINIVDPKNNWSSKYFNDVIAYEKVNKITKEESLEKQKFFWEYVINEHLLKKHVANPNEINYNENIVYFNVNKPEEYSFKGKVARFEFLNNILYAVLQTEQVPWQISYGLRKTQDGLLMAPVADLFKDNEEVQKNIEKRKKEIKIEKQIQKNKNVIQRRSRRAEAIVDTQQPPSEQTTRLINHPDNVQNLKPGDHVLVDPHGYWAYSSYRRRGRRPTRSQKAIVIGLSLEYSGYPQQSSSLVINVQNIRNQETLRIPPRYLTKDESPTAQRIASRSARHQQLVSSTSNFQIGNFIRVTRGRHQGKSGRILNFRIVNGNTTAIISSADHDRNFSVKLDYLEISDPQGVTECSLNFSQFINIIESYV